MPDDNKKPFGSSGPNSALLGIQFGLILDSPKLRIARSAFCARRYSVIFWPSGEGAEVKLKLNMQSTKNKVWGALPCIGKGKGISLSFIDT